MRFEFSNEITSNKMQRIGKRTASTMHIAIGSQNVIQAISNNYTGDSIVQQIQRKIHDLKTHNNRMIILIWISG